MKQLHRHLHTYPDGPDVSLSFFHVLDYQGEIKNLVFEQIAWSELARLLNFDFLDGDLPLSPNSTSCAREILGRSLWRRGILALRRIYRAIWISQPGAVKLSSVHFKAPQHLVTRTLVALSVLSIFAALVQPVQADVYMYKDEQGVDLH